MYRCASLLYVLWTLFYICWCNADPLLSLPKPTTDALINLQIKGALSKSCNRILDLGAYTGNWSMALQNSGICATDSIFIMVEGNYDHKEVLKGLKGISYDFILALLGANTNSDQEHEANDDVQQSDEEATLPHVKYYRAGEITRSVNHEASASNSVRRNLADIYRLDTEVEERALHSLDSLLSGFKYTGPEWAFDIIRVDTEGFELEVLRGALGTLENSPNAMIIMKTPIFPYLEGLPPIFEVHSFMHSLGYALSDVIELKYAAFDGITELFYTDMIWVRRNQLVVTNWHSEARSHNDGLAAEAGTTAVLPRWNCTLV